jgi:hypothetical protein
MSWIVIVASVAALTAIIYCVARVRKTQEALGMASIKRWKKGWVPITVLVNDEDFLPEEIPRLRDAVKSAARFWNTQTQVRLFAPPTEVGAGAVIPVMRHNPLTMEDHDDAVAYASLSVSLRGSLSRAAVYMVNWENLDSLTLARAMKHELGHCLGLAHDKIEYSVMYDRASRRVYCVSPADKAFLKEVYG